MQNGNIEDRSVAGADPEADDGSDLLRLASLGGLEAILVGSDPARRAASSSPPKRKCRPERPGPPWPDIQARFLRPLSALPRRPHLQPPEVAQLDLQQPIGRGADHRVERPCRYSKYRT
jgi:hypothetical protein